MKLSSREMVLSCLTGAVVLLSVSYFVGAPQIAAWRAARLERGKLDDQKKVAQRLIQQLPEWQQRYDELRARIPQHGPNDPVTAEMLKTVKRLADQNGVSISRIEPDKEKSIGELAEVAVDCTWDGELEPLVRFLYAVQTQAAILDVRQLTIAPAQGVQGRLKGNFTVFFAFSRAEAKPAAPAVQPPSS